MTAAAKATVLAYLEQAAGTRTSSQIGRAARLRPHDVAAICLELQREGLVERRHTGWKAKALQAAARPAGQSQTGPVNLVGGSRGTTVTTASGADPESPIAVPDPASRWIDFRRLCLYYAECLRVEERPRIAAFADKAGTAFYQLDHRVDGRALAAGQPLNLTLDDDLRRFVRSSSIVRQFKTVYVGAPVDVLQGGSGQDAYTLITPVVVVPTVARLGDRYLELVPSGSVEINYGWLEKRVRRETERRQLLQELGLDIADFDADGAGHLRVDSLDAVARELFLVKRDWFRESPETGRPSTSPAFKDLDPGIYNRFLLMEAPKLQYAHRVVGELHEIALRALDEDLDRTALSHVFPHRAPASPDVVDEDGPFSDGEPVGASETELVVAEPPAHESDEQSIAELSLLNQDQLDACRLALSQPVTVITGPPGTGKSLVVRHVLANMAVRRRSVVFASRNHQALEAVEPWLNQQVSPEQLVLRPVYRYGEQVRSFQWMRALTELLATPTHIDESNLAGDATEHLLDLLHQRRRAESGIERICELQERLANLETAIASDLAQLDGQWQELVWTGSRLPERESLEQLGELAQRAAEPRSWWRRVLDRLLRRDLVRQVDLAHRAIVAAIPADVIEAVPQMLRSAPCDQDRFAALQEDVGTMVRIVDLSEKAAQIPEVRTQIDSMPPRSILSNELSELVGPSHGAFRDLLSARTKSFGSEISNEARVAFANLRSAMRNRPEELEGDPERSKFGREFRKWLPELLRHFPLWALPNLSVGKVVPLASGVFDLVVIDEASQCDIATIVPLLYRAKRCVIVGDPHQLPHVTRMGRGVEMKIREQHGVADYDFERFTFVTNSCFELVANSPDRSSVFLANHYRCHPDIVEYCNDAGFYNGSLRVCTDVDRLRLALGNWKARRACAWQNVVGGFESASSGCMCRAEIDAIVAALVDLESQGFVGKVGVVTPFRTQADRINDAVSSRFGSQLPATWKLQVHTADGFQGDERDIILFSLCGGPDMPVGSRNFLAGDANRFNVAVSRARSVLRVFGNLQWARGSGIGHIQALAERCIAAEGAGRSVRTDLIGPVWEPRLAEALREAEIDFEQQYLTCGFYLDFAILRDDVRIDIEVDGETYHRSAGGGRRIEDLYRDHLLIAAGWTILRFWVYELREDLDECIRRIQQCIADRAG